MPTSPIQLNTPPRNRKITSDLRLKSLGLSAVEDDVLLVLGSVDDVLLAGEGVDGVLMMISQSSEPT